MGEWMNTEGENRPWGLFEIIFWGLDNDKPLADIIVSEFLTFGEENGLKCTDGSVSNGNRNDIQI